MQDLADDISGATAPLSGALTLGLPPTVAEILATHLIQRTMEEYPEVKLRITSGFSGHVQDWLLRGKVDLGVAYEGQKSPSVKAHPIIIEQLFLIQSADGKGGLDGVPILARDALSGPLILPNPEHGLRSRVGSIAQKEKIDLSVVLEIDILPTMLAFVERGLGSTILPLVSVTRQVREGRLRRSKARPTGPRRRMTAWPELSARGTSGVFFPRRRRGPRRHRRCRASPAATSPHTPAPRPDRGRTSRG